MVEVRGRTDSQVDAIKGYLFDQQTIECVDVGTCERHDASVYIANSYLLQEHGRPSGESDAVLGSALNALNSDIADRGGGVGNHGNAVFARRAVALNGQILNGDSLRADDVDLSLHRPALNGKVVDPDLNVLRASAGDIDDIVQPQLRLGQCVSERSGLANSGTVSSQGLGCRWQQADKERERAPCIAPGRHDSIPMRRDRSYDFPLADAAPRKSH